MVRTHTQAQTPCDWQTLGSKMKRLVWLFCCCLTLIACGETTANPSKIWRVRADQVVDSEQRPVWLRGVQFTNWAGDDPAHAKPAAIYADQSDYQRAAAMGVNTIAFFFRADQFEVDGAPYHYDQSGFDWLDQHIGWAKASGIRLILTLLTPPGSPPQWSCDGNTVWDVPEYEDRTVALWQALAQRYENEPVIAGYNLLAAPMPAKSADQWPALANRLVSAIRAHDRQHLLVLEIATGVACKYTPRLSAADLFRVQDPNVLYAFSAFLPWEYVGQLLPNYGLGDGGVYPDETQLGQLNWEDSCDTASCDLQWEHNSWDSIPPEAHVILKPEETSWTEKQFAYRVTNRDYQIGVPVLQSDNNLGKVYFDDFTVNEYDPDLNLVRTVLDVDLEDPSSWYLYQSGDDGNCESCGGVAALESEAHRGQTSISLSGTTTPASFSNTALAFPARLNYVYKVTGWIKGENSAAKGASRFRLDFYKDNQHDGVLPLRNRDYLASYLQSFVDWGNTQRVPLYVSDFGTGRPTFGGDKGGLRWVEDMLGLLKANNCHFAYAEYRGDEFGIYSRTDDLSDAPAANQPLIDLLTSELSH